MSSDRTWTVVRFSSDSMLATVPTTWLKKGNKCYYPALTKEKLEEAIKNHHPFDVCWPTHNVKVIINSTSDSYDIAKKTQMKMEKGASTSASKKQINEGIKRLSLAGPSTESNSSLDNAAVTQGAEVPNFSWNARSTELLLDTYGKYKEDLDWNVIAREMSKENGVTISSTDCSQKFSRMKNDFEKNQKDYSKSGLKPTWRYFDKMKSLFPQE